MIALKTIFIIFFILLYVVMMSVMIIFERDKPRNIIVWSMLFLFTQIIGFSLYIANRFVFDAKKKELIKKQHEDGVYGNLINTKIYNKHLNVDDELFNFNQKAYNAKLTQKNNYQILTNYLDFKQDLISSIKSSKCYIILELKKINRKDFEDIIPHLIAKAEEGVAIKIVHDKLINLKLKKELINNGIKVYRFSKYNTLGGVYANLRNQIVIDGKVAYIVNTNIKCKQLEETSDKSEVIFKLSGEIVEEIDIVSHQDYVFASGKFMDYNPASKLDVTTKSLMQYISNEFSTDIELLIIKAICSAKKSIQLELEEFIPTESIMSLLRFAINSNIEVRLMVPLKTNNHSKYFATRAYAKELALMGANVYLYDGYINFNGIVIDNEYVLYGAYSMDREHISMGIQSVILFKDSNLVDYFNKLFDKDINNSYRINNAKYMLLREKFFKNFV